MPYSGINKHITMLLQQIKDKYQRFKQWQQQPVRYHMSDDVHHCNNCGLDFTGNYCPCCSQKAEMGRINWQSVHQGVMDVWGLGTRSLLYSVWQLLLRPGYFINDYISGKRQVSFPPVKMLFIVTVIYSLVIYWFLPHVLGLNFAKIEEANMVGYNQAMAPLLEWSRVNYSWSMLLMSVLAIIPTWLLFRESPRNHHHSLPEGFFIQVLMSVLMVVVYFILTPLGFMDYVTFLFISCGVMVFYYIVSYNRLFGYGIWGTLWRQVFVMIPVIYFLTALVFLLFDIDMSLLFPQSGAITPKQNVLMRMGAATASMTFSLMVLAVGCIINYLVTMKARKQWRQQNR